jgi:iron complex outermembrane receptor protein
MPAFSIVARSLAGCAVIVAVPNTALAKPQEVSFKIAEQPVQAALAQFSQQSGLRLLYPYEQIVGLRSQGVTGAMLPRDALTRLIRGTPLKIVVIKDGYVALRADKAALRPVALAAAMTRPMTGQTPQRRDSRAAGG